MLFAWDTVDGAVVVVDDGNVVGATAAVGDAAVVPVESSPGVDMMLRRTPGGSCSWPELCVGLTGFSI